jgi:hypothetical protein
MSAAAETTPVKRCVVCGVDLSNAKRTKVPSGDYYCEACYAKQTAAIAAVAQPRLSPSPGNPGEGRGEGSASSNSDAVTPLPMSSGGGNMVFLAMAAALLIMIVVAIMAYMWFTSPSRRSVVVAPTAAAVGMPSNPRATSKASVPAIAAKDINARDDHGRTALYLAAEHGDIGEVRLLLDKGADVNTKDNAGDTPLHATARKGHPATSELLVARGADVNAVNKKGSTPLHVAAAYGNMGLADWLAGKVADVNARDKAGHTPLTRALENKHDGTAAAIRKHGGKE